ncbi:MAG: type 2 lantipeptide synthetase LanM [Bacteroidetes bacterium]|nr:type 2 lantipeptide synthetase LanM [Bacteroidota bacterium]
MRELIISELRNVVIHHKVNEENHDISFESETIYSEWKEQLFVNEIDFFSEKLRKENLQPSQFKNLIKFYLTKKQKKIPNEFVKDITLLGLTNNELGYLTLFEDIINTHLNEIDIFFSHTKFKVILDKNKKNIINSFIKYLCDNLEKLSEKTIFYEFKVWESTFDNEGVINRKEKTNLFYEKLREIEFKLHFYNEYPVLYRLIKDEIVRLKCNLIELFNRLLDDFNEIHNQFSLKEKDSVLSIDFGLGDRHNKGKTVSIINFESGKKIVYKPHSLELDVKFNFFIKHLSSELKHEIISPKTISKLDYGWQEFIIHEKTNDTKLLQEFYYKIGVHLSVFYLLNGGDLHFENIISSLSNPMVIDIETLFQPKFNEKKDDRLLSFDNVSKVTLLPFMMDVGDGYLELGGLADPSGQKSPLKKTKFNTETGKLDSEDIYFKDNRNIPFTKESKHRLLDFADFIVEGFSNCYNIFLNSKDEKTNLINELFEGCKIRVLVRDTLIYSHLLKEETHPSLLTNGFKIDMHFDWLWGHVAHFKYLEPVIEIEKNSLINFDIPYFFTEFSSKKLHTVNDGEIDDFFLYSSKKCLNDSFKNISKEDLKRQEWVIRASILGYERSNKKIMHNINPSEIIEKEINLFEETKRIADELMNISFQNNQYASWLNIEFSGVNNEVYSIEETDYSFHNGLLGDLIFFQTLAFISKEKKYVLFADKIYNYLIESIKKDIHNTTNIGVHTGLGGLLYSLTILYEITKDITFISDLEDIIETLDFKKLIDESKANSLVKGRAGFLISLCKYYPYAKDKSIILDSINYCCDKLIEDAIFEDNFVSWLPEYNKKPLTGLAHGSSGYALAFLKAFNLTNNINYQEIIQKIINFENTFYDSQFKNWLDRRDFIVNDNDRYKSYGWSHGAPGIGLVRVKLLENKKISNSFKKVLEKDLKISIESTIKNGFIKNNDNLVYGKMGNIDLLIESSKYKNEINYLRILRTILSQKEDLGWRFGFNPSLFYKPGLMTGCSGIGYQLLRCIDHDLPSLLALD